MAIVYVLVAHVGLMWHSMNILPWQYLLHKHGTLSWTDASEVVARGQNNAYNISTYSFDKSMTSKARIFCITCSKPEYSPILTRVYLLATHLTE